jgi:hypothetical protein
VTEQAIIEYRRLVADHAATTAIHQSYSDGQATVRRDLADASEAVHAGEDLVAARELALARVDQQAEQIWQELRTLRGRRIGDLAPPATAAGNPDQLLRSAASRIARARRGGGIRGHVLATLPVLGAVCATIVALGASGLLRLGAPLAWLLFVLAPGAGLPVAARYVDRRDGTRLDTGAIGLTLLGGMLAALACALLLR